MLFLNVCMRQVTKGYLQSLLEVSDWYTLYIEGKARQFCEMSVMLIYCGTDLS